MFDATQKARLLRDAAECMAEADAAAAAAAAAAKEAHRAKSEAQRLRMRELLLESYLHRDIDGGACSMCGRSDKPLAIHVIEKTFGNTSEIPYRQGAIYYGYSAGYIGGFFPLCTKCAPPCKKCKLPTDPPRVHDFAVSIQAKLGLGICTDHIHWRYIVQGLVARILRRH